MANHEKLSQVNRGVKLIFLFKRADKELTLNEFAFVGFVRLISVFLIIFVIGCFVMFVFNQLPALKDYSGYFIIPTPHNAIFNAMITGLLTVAWGAIVCGVLFIGSFVLYALCLLLGGGFSD